MKRHDKHISFLIFMNKLLSGFDVTHSIDVNHQHATFIILIYKPGIESAPEHDHMRGFVAKLDEL